MSSAMAEDHYRDLDRLISELAEKIRAKRLGELDDNRGWYKMRLAMAAMMHQRDELEERLLTQGSGSVILHL